MTTYDWTWRQNGPMTFHKIYREAVEICSPELYLRWVVVREYLTQMRWHGLDRRNGFTITPAIRRSCDHAFVRTYLAERRAGLPPRAPGPPAGTCEAIAEVARSCERAYLAAKSDRLRRETEQFIARRYNEWRAVWIAVGTMAAEDQRG